MLFIKLQPGQAVRITLPDGRTGTIETWHNGRGKVRVYCDFPVSVPVDRSEVHEQKKAKP